jgi:hypothetical protein
LFNKSKEELTIKKSEEVFEIKTRGKVEKTNKQKNSSGNLKYVQRN